MQQQNNYHQTTYAAQNGQTQQQMFYNQPCDAMDVQPTPVVQQPMFTIRDPKTRPVYLMTADLLTTYRHINEIYYKKKNSVDYQVKPHETFHERYDVIGGLGKEGSFGQVVSALDKANNERVAIKIIKNKTSFYNQALSEIELLKLINSKDPECLYGVRMKNTFMYQGHLCIVFELLSMNLYDLLKGMHFRGIGLPLVKRFAEQLLKALWFLSRPDVDIIHCDLKPENILLRDPKRSNIKVIDFGSSCRSNGRMYKYIQSRFYRCPEVLLELDYGHPIDMWSLGCILVEIHTGEPLFPGQNEVDQMSHICTVLGTPPDVMIDASPKAKKFFVKSVDNYGNRRYELRQPPQTQTKGSLEAILKGGARSENAMEDLKFRDLISRMLTLDPTRRITPIDALQHSFFVQTHEEYTSPGPAHHGQQSGASLRAAVQQFANPHNNMLTSQGQNKRPNSRVMISSAPPTLRGGQLMEQTTKTEISTQTDGMMIEEEIIPRHWFSDIFQESLAWQFTADLASYVTVQYLLTVIVKGPTVFHYFLYVAESGCCLLSRVPLLITSVRFGDAGLCPKTFSFSRPPLKHTPTEMKASLLVLFSLVATACGFWTYQGRAQPNHYHSIIFAVKTQPLAASTCDNTLSQLSVPSSPRYGKHMTLAQVNAMTLDTAAVSRVESWLSSEGIAFSTTGDYIRVSGSIRQMERLLSAKFGVYTHKDIKAKTFFHTEAYTVPSQIAADVDFVIHAQLPKVLPLIRTLFDNDGGFVNATTPQLLNKYYGIRSNNVSQATQAIFASLGQSFSPDDLITFQNTFNLPQITVQSVTGNNDPNSCQNNPDTCGEANLDVQYLLAISQSANTNFDSISKGSNDAFLDFIVGLSQNPTPANIYSISYGATLSQGTEADDPDYQRFNLEACKLGLRGVTIVVASGDDGVNGPQLRQGQCGFAPSFPATSPYVLTVGATMGPEGGAPEVACTSDLGGVITTGGGFSTGFPMPSYQTAAVQNYLQTSQKLPDSSLYNSGNRAYPDVSAMGNSYIVVTAGQTNGASGTSASAPVFAAMLSLINDMRLNQGKPTLGFVNPAIYNAPPQTWNDITIGSDGCASGQGNLNCCDQFFSAAVGWDPLTGLGSPKFPALSSYLASL
ncbi:hypothetical protein PROFUN_09939 [Planoprotostelium fungivorum]|uniref:Dual-specificity kinase n=1 Tax=Planoprotostelium fungivorum TaxID=1890364 RepID=A0A2P6NGA2_9EUKA|nr:hypothetical protein PROFUN_09939 [Planoprotostelium fungivorum]